MEKEVVSSYFKLHLIVIIYGFTAILGKLIEMPAMNLVWFRMLIAVITFFIYLKITKNELNISLKAFVQFLGVGAVVAAHWVSFFWAIKLSNVSVALGCFATTTLFASVIEPLFFRKRIKLLEVFIGLIIICGLYLIFAFEMNYLAGILVSLLSALLAALFTVLNKKLVAAYNAPVISFYELLGGFILLTLFLAVIGDFSVETFHFPTKTDWLYLLLLGTVCTAFAFVVQIDIMRHLTAYTVTLAINLEPVYGIIMAFFLFGESEKMTSGFYFGALVILAAVFVFPVLNKLFYAEIPDKINQID